VRLCEKERIPLRNLIGKDAWGMQILARLVPDFVRVALVELVLELKFDSGVVIFK
jgi:hypothetical protein